MSTQHQRLSAAAMTSVVLALAGVGVAASAADASPASPSTVTARASDRMPASGKTFRLRGTVESQGHGTPSTITVKTLRHGRWVPLTGASVHTDRSGRYSLRVILDARGKRELRVVADPDAGGIRASRTTLSVSVGMPGNSTCD